MENSIYLYRSPFESVSSLKSKKKGEKTTNKQNNLSKTFNPNLFLCLKRRRCLKQIKLWQDNPCLVSLWETLYQTFGLSLSGTQYITINIKWFCSVLLMSCLFANTLCSCVQQVPRCVLSLLLQQHTNHIPKLGRWLKYYHATSSWTM